MGVWLSIVLSALFGSPSRDRAPLCHILPASRGAYRINRSDSALLPFIPPASWTGHRVDKSPCHCSTDCTGLGASLKDMDPLIADGYHNLTCSPLCRLPEELLLDIMKRLDIVSIQCLRRISRLFLRLYCSPHFRRSHRDSTRILSTPNYDHWYEPKGELRDSWSPLLQLLDEDISDYCEDCQKRRTDQSWTTKSTSLTMDYLHCSGCHFDHPTYLFSRNQRSKSPKVRICIGREGFVRVCEHQTVTWDVIVPGRRLATLDTNQALIFLSQCQHESHFPKHDQNDTSLTGNQRIYPVVHLLGSRNKQIMVELVWCGHLYLPDTGFNEEGYNELATPTLIR